MNEKNVQDILALTPMQEGMLYHYLKNPQCDLYFEQLSLGISGEIDLEMFEKAWNYVIDTNEMLRTLFRWEKMKHPIQVVLKKHHITPLYHDFSNMHRSEKEKLSQEVKINDRKKKFDLREVPWRITLCKMEKSQYAMIISNHHILYDGWSNGIILQEFFNAYNDLSKRKKLIKPVKTKFKEFIKWGQTRDNKKEEKFWRDYLKGFDTPTELSIKRRRKTRDIINTGKQRIIVDKNRKEELGFFIKEHKITLASLLYTAWGLLLQKYNNTKDVIFGTTVSGRSVKINGIEDMVGLFINTLPFRMQTDFNEKILDHLHRVNDSLQIREEYEHSSQVKIKEYSELDNNEAFFDTILVIENYPLERLLLQENKNSQLSVNSFSMVEITNYDLTVGIVISETFEIDFTYNRAFFDEETIERLFNHFIFLIGEIIDNPGRKSSGIGIISEEEKKQVLYEFNDTGAEYPGDKTIHQLLEEQVDRTPDHVALIGEIPNSKSQIPNKEAPFGQINACGEIQLTYKEFNDKSNRLACLLIEKGVQPDTIVGIMMERSIEMPVSIFAILKAGGAYLPIDPNYPEERVNYMLADSKVKFLIKKSNIFGGSSCEQELFVLDFEHLEWEFVSNFEFRTSNLNSSNLCYIIYTSGST
ncbi:MAG: AMP-binding protein, partial [Candidatus Aminicenantes bacterium]